MHEIGSIFNYVKLIQYGNNKPMYVDAGKIEAIQECEDHSNKKIYTSIYIGGCRFPVAHTCDELFKKIDDCDKTRERAWKVHYDKVEKASPVPPTK